MSDRAIPSERRDRYEPVAIEAAWRAKWNDAKLFEVADPRGEEVARKYYLLEMLPYPSGRIHMGHVRNYAIGDVLARFHRMRGKHVLHPMGWDAFGMPAENAAIERGLHPATWTRENIATMKAQLAPLGFSYDWSREIATCDPEYYRWEQLVFTRMLEAGLAYKTRALANWCGTCETVLANEQVDDGKCWRCGTTVRTRELEQWFLRITRYADELLEGIESLAGAWPDQVLTMQRNWIGRSEGARVRFPLETPIAGHDAIEVFTTRPDTLYGVTFLSIAPEHPIATALAASGSNAAAVRAFLETMAARTDRERSAEHAPKDGVSTGIHVVHPLTGAKVPVWIGSFVLMGYGTGAVMAVPAHDTRDFAFAREHALPIKVVIQPSDAPTLPPDGTGMHEAFTGAGRMVDSDDFTGTPNEDGKKKIALRLKEKGLGEPTVQYRLHDWLISRQRYWIGALPRDTRPASPSPEAVTLRRKLHQTILRATHDIDVRRQFNTAIAAMMELVNAMVAASARAANGEAGTGIVAALHECADTLVHLLSPFAPHLADELYAGLGGEGFLLDQPWPVADEEAAREDHVEIGVQIDGKARGRIRISKDADQATAMAAALAEPTLGTHLGGKTPTKIIYVAGRILNVIL